jgi:general secretion pathway protein H
MASSAELAKMPIRGIDRSRALSRESGFTLVEMLAVVVMLAVAAALASVKLGSHGGAAQARALLLNSSDVLRNARLMALRTGIEQVVYVDVPRRRIDSIGRRTLRVPPELGFAAVAARSEQQGDNAFGIRFFPDGTSTGGELKFATQGRIYELHVNWLTGNVTINDG